MALIKCNECGNSVSDTAKTCPSCGSKIISDTLKKKNKKRKKILLITIISLIILSIAGFVTFKIIENNKINKYKENYEEILDKIISSTDKTEDCLILYRKVWYNTIFEEDDSETDQYTKDSNGKFYDDFNDSLFGLYISEDYTKKINEIKNDSKITIPTLLKELENPPKDWEDAYNTLEDLVDAYLSFADMAIDPSGNLTSFTEKYNELDDEIASLYKKAYRNVE